jgi:LPPG:FO 2-phospho-L-lactate transferase
MDKQLKITALAGGVGGAKLADGLSRCFPDKPVTIIVNTGDDLELFGLHICPDLDTVCYTLAGLANPATGWGRAEESWQVYETLSKMGAPDWFRLGDKDLALHMERTRLLKNGYSMSETTKLLCEYLKVKDRVIPMSDQPVHTMVHTRDGRILRFQEYFVKENCQPAVSGFKFEGISSAYPAPGILKVIEESDLVILCPSNPWVSIDPILMVKGIKPLLQDKRVVAVSPIICGKTIKGPAAKMFTELGLPPGSLSVADHYRDLLTGFIFDTQDQADTEKISAWGIIPRATNIIMRSTADRVRLAEETINFGISLSPKG